MQTFHLDTVDSTNEAAKRLIEVGRISEPCYLTAREQTAGKGSHGRVWLSPRDAGLYLSVIDLPGELSRPVTPAYTLAAGVACVEVVSEVTGLTPQLKPINDVYVGGAKLGGILVEAVIRAASVRAIITGIGLNVYYADRPLGPDAVRPVCLQQTLPQDALDRLDLSDLAEALATRVLHWNAQVHAGREDEVRRLWEYHTTAPSPTSPKPLASDRP